MKMCIVENCNKPVHAKGYCNKHYRRYLRHGDVTKVKNEQHGMRQTREYNTWRGMRERCYNKNHAHYNRYGGRGITVCDRWKNSFNNFYNDMGNIPKDKEIDRINNNGNYEPSNCRFITHVENCHNTTKTSLNWFTVNSIRNLFSMKNYTHKQLCTIFNISESLLQKIVYNVSWKKL